MKALVIAAALAAFSSVAPAGAAREAQSQDRLDTATATTLADAGRLGSAGLTALAPGGSWNAATEQTDTGASFEAPPPEIDAGSLLIGGGLLALLLARPLGRSLRRLEQQRRAAALASTLGQHPRG